MEYKANRCKKCGSSNLTVLNSYEQDGDVFYKYRCESCGNEFSTENEMNYSEVKKSAKKPNIFTAADIFKASSKNTLNLFCTHDNTVSCGTGVYIGKGYILTNAHVLEYEEGQRCLISIDNITAKLGQNDKLYKLEYVSSGRNVDLAILKVEDVSDFEQATLCKEPVTTGEKVFAVGNAKGLGLSIVDGIVSNAKTIDKHGTQFVMFSAPVNHGNSGGPLFNENGQVIGVVTFGLQDANLMNYAISVATIMDFIKSVEKREEIKILWKLLAE